MAKTEEDVAQNLVRLNDEVINLLVQEYAWQIAKWKDPLNTIADAYTEALKQVNSVIDQVVSRQKAATELVLGAMMLAGGAAVGWLAPMANKALQSKYKSTFQDIFVDGEYFVQMVATPGAARAKYFGEVIKPGMDAGVNAGIKALFSSDAKGENEAFNAIRSVSYLSFKTSFEKVFNKEIELTGTELGKLKHAATLNRNFGHDIMDSVRKDPWANAKNVTLDQLEEIASNSIYNSYDYIREQWAKDWFYFGNNPGIRGWDSLPDEMEIALWAMWVRSQDFKVLNFGMIQVIDGKDKVQPAHPIMLRLTKDLFQTRLIDLEYHSHNPWSASLIVGSLANDSIPPSDLPTLKDWAKGRPNADKAGRSLFKKRAIGTIKDKDSIFKN